MHTYMYMYIYIHVYLHIYICLQLQHKWKRNTTIGLWRVPVFSDRIQCLKVDESNGYRIRTSHTE